MKPRSRKAPLTSLAVPVGPAAHSSRGRCHPPGCPQGQLLCLPPSLSHVFMDASVHGAHAACGAAPMGALSHRAPGEWWEKLSSQKSDSVMETTQTGWMWSRGCQIPRGVRGRRNNLRFHHLKAASPPAGLRAVGWAVPWLLWTVPGGTSAAWLCIPWVRRGKFLLGARVAANNLCSHRANRGLIPVGRWHRYPLRPGRSGSVGSISMRGLGNLLLFYPSDSLRPLPKQRGVCASSGVTVRLTGTSAAFGSVPRAARSRPPPPRWAPKAAPLAGNS